MKKSDRQLGMGRDITRRDFIHDVGMSSLGLSSLGLPLGIAACSAQPPDPEYPPTRTGLRGSHPGSFEVAHALAREGQRFENAADLGEQYDLVVVGGGISGLAAAWFYRRQFGPDSRILVIENHDDFGGHAKRNEFNQGGVMRLAWGGVFNLEYPEFSDTVNELLAELGVDIDRLLENYDFNYGADGKLGPAIFFDADNYGRDVLIPGFGLRYVDPSDNLEGINQMPISEASRASLKAFFETRTDVLEGFSPSERAEYLSQISYIDFLKEHGGLTDEAAALFTKTTDGYWGVGANKLSVAECLGAAVPIEHLLGGSLQDLEAYSDDVAMFPDGNASIARLLVRGVIPESAPGSSMDDIVTAPFDYGMLDRDGSAVRIRLNSTAVAVINRDEDVAVSYVRDGRTERVTARHCVLACWHSIIPYICPDLPQAQKEAMAYQVKRPLVLTNVLLRSSVAADRLGIAGAYCPGRLHAATWLVKGINVGDYRHEWDDQGPVVMMFWGAPDAGSKSMSPREQHRLARAELLEMNFEDFEREVRTVLNGMLGPGGFDAAQDVLAVTVNRWPHGYAYDYLDLWDPEWPPGEAPHEIARQRFGNITIANADAGADAYTHVAIDQAWRAVQDLAK